MNHTETVKRVLREYHNRITALEDKKFDIEYVVKKKDFEVLFRERQDRVHDTHVTITINVVALV